MEINLPEEINQLLGVQPYELDTVGKSGSKILLFQDVVLKISETEPAAVCEIQMLKWLQNRLPVPKLIKVVEENGLLYLLMGRIDGSMACSPTYLNQPRVLVNLLADALQMIWSVDVSSCPSLHRDLDTKLALAEDRVKKGLCSLEDVEPGTYGEGGFQDPAHLLQWLKSHRPKEELVFSHGDFCLPNIMITGHTISGFLDLGCCGTADRYQDIALCYRSLKHNFDGRYGGKRFEGYEPKRLFDALGMIPDWDKIRYYILLDELF